MQDYSHGSSFRYSSSHSVSTLEPSSPPRSKTAEELDTFTAYGLHVSMRTVHSGVCYNKHNTFHNVDLRIRVCTLRLTRIQLPHVELVTLRRVDSVSYPSTRRGTCHDLLELLCNITNNDVPSAHLPIRCLLSINASSTMWTEKKQVLSISTSHCFDEWRSCKDTYQVFHD
jgi:hypothetical protein